MFSDDFRSPIVCSRREQHIRLHLLVHIPNPKSREAAYNYLRS